MEIAQHLQLFTFSNLCRLFVDGTAQLFIECNVAGPAANRLQDIKHFKIGHVNLAICHAHQWYISNIKEKTLFIYMLLMLHTFKPIFECKYLGHLDKTNHWY